MKETELEIIYLPVKDLLPYAKNARKHTEKDIETIVNSIKSFSFSDPVGVWGGNNVIVEGHGRVLAAKKLGMKEVPCIRLDHLNDDERRAYALAHNRTAEMSDWLDDILNEELDALEDLFDMSDFGFEIEEKDQVREDDYEPDPPEAPKAQIGDVYKLGVHRLMCGDSTDINDVETLCDGQEMDMLLTDPPYNVDYNGKEERLLDAIKDRQNARAEEKNFTDIQNDNMDSQKFREFLTSAFFNAKEQLKMGGVFHVWHSEWEAYNFRGALKDVGLKCRQQLIWIKNNISIGRQDFQRMYESVLTVDNLMDEEMEAAGYDQCLYGWKDGAGHTWKKKRKEKDVLYFDKPRASEKHPMMKPILLFDYEMKCNTAKGDKVLDLFAGSGTTIMAAEQNGRVAFCMEHDPKFVDVIIDRYISFVGGDEEVFLIRDGKEIPYSHVE